MGLGFGKNLNHPTIEKYLQFFFFFSTKGPGHKPFNHISLKNGSCFPHVRYLLLQPHGKISAKSIPYCSGIRPLSKQCTSIHSKILLKLALG